MSYLAATNKLVAISKKLQLNFYDYKNHDIVDIVTPPKSPECDQITDVVLTADSKYLAAITSSSKLLVLFELPVIRSPKIFTLPRSASKIRFTTNNSHILVADKSGDVLIYDIMSEKSGTKLLGHLSLLLDVLQTSNEKFLITSDRDEKIRVSCFPNTYNIHTYCLGHKEFVNHIELLPNDTNYLVSSSGDGTVKIWKYEEGKVCYTINTSNDVNDLELKQNFIDEMDKEGIEVSALPVVHFVILKLDKLSSLIVLSVHSYNELLVYRVVLNSNNIFTHKLETKLQLEKFPSALGFYDTTLIIYESLCNSITFYNVIQSNNSIALELYKTETAFGSSSTEKINGVNSNLDTIKVLYKRRFDNVQEYQERKKQRLEKSGIKCI